MIASLVFSTAVKMNFTCFIFVVVWGWLLMFLKNYNKFLFQLQFMLSASNGREGLVQVLFCSGHGDFWLSKYVIMVGKLVRVL